MEACNELHDWNPSQSDAINLTDLNFPLVGEFAWEILGQALKEVPLIGSRKPCPVLQGDLVPPP